MFALIHFKGGREVKRKVYNRLQEAENNIYEEFIDCNHYKIYETENMDIIDEGEINPLNINETLGMMYPNKETGDDF
ncbi:MAG TPA: hypothetical protein VNZ49_12930 [Bacteroidia bacterium]|jgi:hypothetical protein|nr:hypothetical protein [Bacteroidia bacterium]